MMPGAEELIMNTGLFIEYPRKDYIFYSAGFPMNNLPVSHLFLHYSFRIIRFMLVPMRIILYKPAKP